MAEDSLAYMPAWQMRDAIARKDLSPVEVVRFFLDRIHRLNPTLNAYLTVTEDLALEQARRAEEAVVKGEPLGPLHGVPVSVKDLMFTEGVRTTYGSVLFRDFVPGETTEAVARLLRAGAVLLGKTNTPEFGLSAMTENLLGPPCRNPWDPTRTPGGSSGGAGAAVAAGLGPLALGSDGGGSIRIPASFCGVFGLKPSRGWVPRTAGLGQPVSNPYSHYGPMTWWVKDAALMLQVMAGYDPRDPYSLRGPVPDFLGSLEQGIRGVRIAWSADLGYASVDPEVIEVCAEAVRALEEQGAVVEEPPIRLEHPSLFFWDLFSGMAYGAYEPILREHRPRLTDYARRTLERGERVTLPQYLMSLRRAEVMAQQIEDLFQRYDLLVTPTLAVPAFPIGEPPSVIAGEEVDPNVGFFPFTPPFNFTGHPAASVPCGFSREGLPIGLQIVGRHREDALVLRAAYALEQARPWQGRRPPVS